MNAGDLRERLTFQSREVVSDGYGNEVGEDWEDQFTVWARLQPKVGGEQVMAARLSGRQVYLIHVRSSSSTRQIAPDWRAVHANDGRVFQVKSPPRNMDEKSHWLEIDAEFGVAA